MKKTVRFLMLGLAAIFASNAQAQESSWGAGVDLYSNYIWRGTKYGTGPAIQPSVSFSAGGLTLGVWGSFDATGYTEVDPYLSYSFSNGLSLGMTNYYYPGSSGEGTSIFKEEANAWEVNAGYTTGGLSLSANYILNEAATAASAGDDLYFQAGYAFEKFNILVGAGDGWHTSDGEFNVCNIGIGTGKEIKITDSFSIPVTGQVILNPEREQLYVVVGITL
ncbi:MAG: hypothetical protein PHI28_15235 [Mangrovibacterium sp.]|nr:hypothetical protein [Mangrovibacterium sp.]